MPVTITIEIADDAHVQRINDALAAHGYADATNAEKIAVVHAELVRHLKSWVYKLERQATIDAATSALAEIDAG